MKPIRWLFAILLVLLMGSSAPAFAGGLTAQEYTYLLDGRSVAVPVDIVPVQRTFLVPRELLQTAGVTVTATGSTAELARGPVTVKLVLRSDTADVDGRTLLLGAAPMAVGDRLFVPAEVALELGFEIQVQGKFVFITDYAAALEKPLSSMDPDAYARLWKAQTVTSSLRQADGASAALQITLLTPAMLQDTQLQIPWGARMKLLALAPARSLAMVTVANTSGRPVQLDPASLSLVNDAGQQADYLNEVLPLDGSVLALLAPGASRTGVLFYSRLTGPITLYDLRFNMTLGRVAGL
ncbi:MAG TPA: stalk domain-containing protein [Symbiobacteriaceae bacterium]|jgi:hypothetical protein|nr:stalk domain-containing protein [Symbiobacteriaceae bacterium]